MADIRSNSVFETSSNAVMASPLAFESGISLYSSIGTVSNTVDRSKVMLGVYVFDKGTQQQKFIHTEYLSSDGSFQYSVDGNSYIQRIYFEFGKSALPVPGNYKLSYDLSSDISMDYFNPYIWTQKSILNAAPVSSQHYISSNFTSSSGDIFVSPVPLTLTSVTRMSLSQGITGTDVQTIGGSVRFNFTPYSGETDFTTAGTDTTSQDLQIDISNNTSQLVTSANSILDSLQDLIQHISNQLAALWDQMYNLMHVPTMDKLNEILSALRAIANNSDIYAVVEEIDSSSREQTSQIVQNANENTTKVEQAVEKHGNFLIEGLKGLFIPSDEYFSTVFNDLNDFFKDKFGFLYTPVDLLIRFINLFSSANAEFTGIPFPELSWDGYVLLEAQTVQFDILQLDAFKNVQQKLYFLTDLMMIGALLALIHKKFEEVMQN